MSDYSQAVEAGTEATRAGAEFFSSLERETRFYIVRHGQSEGNARGIMQGRVDLPLDGSGRAQAHAVGVWLATQGVDRIASSPLSRASETARIISRAAGLAAIETSESLIELDTGVFSGLSLDEARLRFPEAYFAFERRSWDGVPGAESSERLYARAMDAWRFLKACAEGCGGADSGAESVGERGGGSDAGGGSRSCKRVVAVTHGGFIQWLIRATLGVRDWMPLFSTGNCGIFELHVEPNGPGEPAYLLWKRMDHQVPSGIESLPPIF